MVAENEMFPGWRLGDFLNNPLVISDIPADSLKPVFTVWENEGFTFLELRDGTFVLISEPPPQENF